MKLREVSATYTFPRDGLRRARARRSRSPRASCTRGRTSAASIPRRTRRRDPTDGQRPGDHAAARRVHRAPSTSRGEPNAILEYTIILAARLALLAAAACTRPRRRCSSRTPGQLSARRARYVPAQRAAARQRRDRRFRMRVLSLRRRHRACSPTSCRTHLRPRRTSTTTGARCRPTRRTAPARAARNQQPPIYTTLSMARGSADTALAKLQGWTDAQMPTGGESHEADRPVGGVRRLQSRAARRRHVLGGDQRRAGADAGAVVRRSEDALRLGGHRRPPPRTTRRRSTSRLLGRARTLLDLGASARGRRRRREDSVGVHRQHVDRRVNVRRQNFVVPRVNQSSWATVDPSFRGLTINGAPDPRVAVTNTGTNGTAPGSRSGPPTSTRRSRRAMPIARYAEAQLIVAEAKLGGERHSGRGGGDQRRARDARRACRRTTRRGRRRRRCRRRSSRSAAASCSSRDTGSAICGATASPILPRRRARRTGPVGGTYGTQTCFPLPDVERINNPNIPKELRFGIPMLCTCRKAIQ